MLYSEKHNIYFADVEHLDFYERELGRTVTPGDPYHKALFYALGICHDTRRNFGRLYDHSERCINPGEIRAGWQTGTSKKVTRLAYGLFTDRAPTAVGYSEASGEVTEDFTECGKYSVPEIFCCSYAPLFFEAVKLRYPEYTSGERSL